MERGNQRIFDENAAGKAWESITLSNNFVFFKVMQDENRLKELLRRVLPDVKIEKLEVVAQKEIQAGNDVKGVRLDIFAEDDAGRAITIEMQVENNDCLPRRLRYYLSMADQQALEKGRLYRYLPDSYVIIICCFDLYGKGLHRYTFTNRCTEMPEIVMDDGVKYIVLNTTSLKDDVDEELKAFLDYVNGNDVKGDEFIEELDDAVKRARLNKEWRREFMMMDQIKLENQEIGRIEGREEGREEGQKRGEEIGREAGVKAVVDLCKSLGGSSVDAIEQVVASMGFSQPEADRLVTKYW